MRCGYSYKTICTDLEIDEVLTNFLMGHAPEGVSQKYVARMILNSGPAMRSAQAAIPRRIVALLKLA